MDCRCKLIIGDRRGFSLVEALVSGIISSIIAGIIITVFVMYDRELQENGAYLRMQMQYETLAEQIARHTRLASLVLLPTETFSPTLPVQKEATGVQTVFMYDPSGTIIGRYDLGNDTLKEWVNGEWTAFETGGGPVVLESSASSFELSADRKDITLDLTLKTVNKRTTYRINPVRNQFRCRN